MIIYADNAATTPVDPAVLSAMMPYFQDMYFNASSNHVGGMLAKAGVEEARASVAKPIGALPQDIVFTSGSTEAIAMAILGAARGHKGGRRHIVTVATEHAAVLDCCGYLEGHGWSITRLPVTSAGLVDPTDVAQAVTADTLMLCVMAVNNETGVLQDLRPLADLAHAQGALMMTDATQAYGKIPMDVDALGVDLLTLSGHKMYGPKGAGALYVRTSANIPMEPLVYGGAQEHHKRSGTLNVPGIVGLGAAAAKAHAVMHDDHGRIAGLRAQFERAMLDLPGVRINGIEADRSSTISNIMFEGVDIAVLKAELPHVAMSAGSACHSSSAAASHVIVAMGRTQEQAMASLRFSFGRFTTQEDIDRLIGDIVRAHETLRTGVISA